MLSPRLSYALATTVLSLSTAMTAGAQLSLRDAFMEAGRAGHENRGAAALADVHRAQALVPLKGILPSVRVEAGYGRTTDPIRVFGSTMVQRSVTQANFDPARLNHPDAVGNYQAAIVLEQPLLNADAWTGRQSAGHAAAASRSAEQWTQLSTRVDVVRAYYGIVLADERVATLRSAARAAHAHVARAEAMVRQGLVTKSDVLLASVRAGDIDAQLAEAEGAANTTRRQLAMLLGRDLSAVSSILIAATQMPSTEGIRAEVASDTIARSGETRADVLAATDGLAAARGEALRAKASLLPRINGFARYDWNSPTAILAGERNWTAGIMASWNVFTSASELAEVQATAGRARAAEALADGARANARFEIEQTRTALTVALTRLTIAEHAAAQSVEAHRIVTARYAGGLATVAELLDAHASETQSTLSLAQMHWVVIVAAAERRRALGLDPATLSSLDDASRMTATTAQNTRSHQ